MMYFKAFCFFVVLSAAVAQDDHHHQENEPSASATYHTKHPDTMQKRESYPDEGHHPHHYHHAHPKYEFEYIIEDPHTGDIKSQYETSVGDVVDGYYALHQPDGHERVVHYHGDHKNGFHADVKYEIHHEMPKHHH